MATHSVEAQNSNNDFTGPREDEVRGWKYGNPNRELGHQYSGVDQEER